MSEAVECDPCSQKVPQLRAHYPYAVQQHAAAAAAERQRVEANCTATTPEAARQITAKAESAGEKAGLSAAGMILAERLRVKHEHGISFFKWARSYPTLGGVSMNLCMSVGSIDTYVCPCCGGRGAVQRDGAAPMSAAPVAAQGLEERDLRPQAVAAVDKETAQAPTVRGTGLPGD